MNPDQNALIFNQKYKREIGTEIGSIERFRQEVPDVHLNSAAWSQGNQSSVQELIPTIDSNSYLSRLKLICESPASTVCPWECISISGPKHLTKILVEYLRLNPELKIPLPQV